MAERPPGRDGPADRPVPPSPAAKRPTPIRASRSRPSRPPRGRSSDRTALLPGGRSGAEPVAPGGALRVDRPDSRASWRLRPT